MSKERGKWIWRPQGSSNWQYDFIVAGQRYTGSTGCKGKDKALRVARAKRKEAVAEHHRLAIKTGVGGHLRDMTFLAAVNKFFKESGKHDAGVKNTFRLSMRLVDFVGETTPITRIDDGLVAAMVAELREKHVNDDPKRKLISDSYVNLHIDLLERVLRRARQVWKVPLPDEPFWTEHKLQERARTREITAKELMKLEEACRSDMWPVVEFTFASALRRANAAELKWSEVHWGDDVLRLIVKGDKPREVPISPRMADILRAQRGKHPEAVFTFEATRTRTCPMTGKKFVRGQHYPMTAQNMYGYWARLREICKINDLRIHDLRRTRGSYILRATGNLAAVQELLGHAHIQQTREAYGHLLKEDLVQAMKMGSEYEERARERALAEEEDQMVLAELTPEGTSPSD